MAGTIGPHTGHHDKESGHYDELSVDLATLLTADLSELTGDITDGDAVTSLRGKNLTVDEDGKLSAEHDHTAETIRPDTVELSGQSSPVTGLWGTSGELVRLDGGGNIDISKSTTSTSFEVLVGTDFVGVDFDRLDFTNISQLYVSWVARLAHDTDGETITARLAGVDGSEVSHTGSSGGFGTHEPVPYDGSGIDSFYVQAKVSGGTGTVNLQRSKVNVWGEIA